MSLDRSAEIHNEKSNCNVHCLTELKKIRDHAEERYGKVLNQRKTAVAGSQFMLSRHNRSQSNSLDPGGDERASFINIL